jgi:excisionase family DNA binding protein
VDQMNTSNQNFGGRARAAASSSATSFSSSVDMARSPENVDTQGARPFLLTVQDVATLLQISERQVYRIVKTGELFAVRLGKRILRFRPQDVDALVTARLS